MPVPPTLSQLAIAQINFALSASKVCLLALVGIRKKHSRVGSRESGMLALAHNAAMVPPFARLHPVFHAI
jgi:hypothetical protein